MAHRPAPEEFDRPLTEEQVRALQQRLSLLSPHHVADEYRRAYEACRMDGDTIPRASAVQNLVVGWRVLWKWRRNRRGNVDVH